MLTAGLAQVVRKEQNGVVSESVQPDFGFHSLRHVAASLWIEQGATPKQVQHWIGHANINILRWIRTATSGSILRPMMLLRWHQSGACWARNRRENKLGIHVLSMCYGISGKQGKRGKIQ
jgi:hypothetical protein